MFELFRRLLDRGWLFKESGFGLGLDAASFGVLVCDFSICVAMTVVNVGRAGRESGWGGEIAFRMASQPVN